MEYDVVEEIIYGLESGILFGYFCFPLYFIFVFPSCMDSDTYQDEDSENLIRVAFKIIKLGIACFGDIICMC